MIEYSLIDPSITSSTHAAEEAIYPPTMPHTSGRDTPTQPIHQPPLKRSNKNRPSSAPAQRSRHKATQRIPTPHARTPTYTVYASTPTSRPQSARGSNKSFTHISVNNTQQPSTHSLSSSTPAVTPSNKQLRTDECVKDPLSDGGKRVVKKKKKKQARARARSTAELDMGDTAHAADHSSQPHHLTHSSSASLPLDVANVRILSLSHWR